MRLPLLALLSALLPACMSPGLSSGMTTELEYGEVLTVVVRGDEPVLEVRSDGGGVVVTREGLPGSEIRLGARGVTRDVVRGSGTIRIVNASRLRATVTVSVSGAEAVEITGPVVPAPPAQAAPEPVDITA